MQTGKRKSEKWKQLPLSRLIALCHVDADPKPYPVAPPDNYSVIAIRLDEETGIVYAVEHTEFDDWPGTSHYLLFYTIPSEQVSAFVDVNP